VNDEERQALRAEGLDPDAGPGPGEGAGERLADTS
jgi:hypothetical protein